jgi:hypothetical protein
MPSAALHESVGGTSATSVSDARRPHLGGFRKCGVDQQLVARARQRFRRWHRRPCAGARARELTAAGAVMAHAPVSRFHDLRARGALALSAIAWGRAAFDSSFTGPRHDIGPRTRRTNCGASPSSSYDARQGLILATVLASRSHGFLGLQGYCGTSASGWNWLVFGAATAPSWARG